MAIIPVLRLLVIAALAGACASPSVPSPASTATQEPEADGSSAVIATSSVQPSAAPSPSAQTGVVPDVLTIICGETGTEADAERVAIQQDGLHVHIRNTSGKERTFDIEGVGGAAAPVDGIQVWRLPTGEARFSCGPAGSEPVAVELVDPAGYYVSDAIGCSSATTGNIDHAEGALGPKGDLLAVARSQIKGLRIGDRVELAGYVRSPEPRVRVVNGDEVVAVGGYRPDGAGGWLITTASICGGTGLTWGP